MPDRPTTLGWREWASLPDLGVKAIKVKLDTGARTSSLHAFDLKRFTRDGRDMVRFGVHPTQRSAAGAVVAESEVVDERWVRNPGGRRELRPVIETTVGIGATLWKIELTLSRRDEMGFRMLLGRQALKGRALVDPGRSFRAEKRKKRPTTKRLKKGRKRRAGGGGSGSDTPEVAT